jgi:hypothetical protein
MSNTARGGCTTVAACAFIIVYAVACFFYIQYYVTPEMLLPIKEMTGHLFSRSGGSILIPRGTAVPNSRGVSHNSSRVHTPSPILVLKSSRNISSVTKNAVTPAASQNTTEAQATTQAPADKSEKKHEHANDKPPEKKEQKKHVWGFRDVWKYRPRQESAAHQEQRLQAMSDKAASVRVAYVITILREIDSGARDAAAVLAHSIKRALAQPNVMFKSCNLIAIVHPSAMVSRDRLVKAGYQVLEKPVPIEVSRIKHEYMREAIVKDGCCGEKELLKLHAFGLTEYDRVFLLDIDTFFARVRSV